MREWPKMKASMAISPADYRTRILCSGDRQFLFYAADLGGQTCGGHIQLIVFFKFVHDINSTYLSTFYALLTC